MYEQEKRQDKRFCQRVTFGLIILAAIMLAGGLAIGTLIINANLGSRHVAAIEAVAGETGSGSAGVARGPMTLDTSDERIDFRFQHHSMSSTITSLWIMGPVQPGAVDSTTRALTLCGSPCGIVCDTLSVANQVSGTLLQKCDDSTSLFGVLQALREDYTQYYVQVNTGLFPGTSDKGELRAYLTQFLGTPV